MSAAEIVNKVWNYAHVLRDDGVGYGDYVEQITYLIFLKMADERDKAGQQVQVPNKFNWGHLVKLNKNNNRGQTTVSLISYNEIQTRIEQGIDAPSSKNLRPRNSLAHHTAW